MNGRWIRILPLLALAFAAVASAQVAGDPNNALTPNDDAYVYESKEGRFKVTWPSGCAKLLRHEGTGDESTALLFSCNQGEQRGVGCGIAYYSNGVVDDGTPPPRQVIARIEALLAKMGGMIADQRRIARDLPSGLRVEGIDVLATAAEGPGEIRVRGLLHGTDIYILSAWNEDGGLWQDQEYRDFFDSFEPLDE